MNPPARLRAADARSRTVPCPAVRPDGGPPGMCPCLLRGPSESTPAVPDEPMPTSKGSVDDREQQRGRRGPARASGGGHAGWGPGASTPGRRAGAGQRHRHRRREVPALQPSSAGRADGPPGRPGTGPPSRPPGAVLMRGPTAGRVRHRRRGSFCGTVSRKAPSTGERSPSPKDRTRSGSVVLGVTSQNAHREPSGAPPRCTDGDDVHERIPADSGPAAGPA